MRILYLSQLMPYPPDSGPKVRQYYTLRHLAQHHEVTLVAFRRPDDPLGAVEHMHRICAAVLTVPMVRSRVRDVISLAGSWLSGESFIIRRDTVPEMTQLVKHEIAGGKYAIIQADQLWMAQYDRATDYETGFHLLRSWTYDAVILDIMGVRGFVLLNASVHLGFPTVMLTAHALSAAALKQSIEMGARAYIPKEKMIDIAAFLEDVLTLAHGSNVQKMLQRLGGFFNKKFGSQWMEDEQTFSHQVTSGQYEPKPVILKK